jgi:hypothetical protein
VNDKREVVFVNVITNIITNTVYIGHQCCGTDFNLNRLAIRAIQDSTSSHIVYLDPTGKLIDRVNITVLDTISLQFSPSGESTTTLFVPLPATNTLLF